LSSKVLTDVKEYFEKGIQADETLPNKILESVYAKKHIPAIKEYSAL
jgi:hypothetical protein